MPRVIEDDSEEDDEDDAYIGEDYGEEEGVVEVEEEHVEEESILTEYDPEDFISGAINSLDSTIPLNLFDFEYSYGYDCHKYFNLCACDDAVVCWAAGSIIVFMDVNTKQIWFRRSSTGGSVGNIASYRKDPNYRIAIAEGREGEKEPLIIMYTWPQMEIDAVLREGTENAYAMLDFSPEGDLLASVGKENDYNLTIWDWKRHKIMLRTSAFTYDVNNVMFSPYCPGQLTTAGAAHLKFWKMAQTFTGLKLKGELGRFGKTEICDVLGVYPMPDEKVLSGCEWGNVLVWEAGLVKLEVTQRGRKTCHQAPIIQFMLSPAGDEVTTIARDGCIRAWYWDTVEQADPPEDDQYVELNPVAETCVPNCQIMSLKHQDGKYWYAQDGNGGIWVVELDVDKLEECNHRKVLVSHAGAIVTMIALRNHPILITAGEDGAIMAYSTETHKLLARYIFPAAVTSMLYPPMDVDPTSRIVVAGFADGIMRALLIHPDRLEHQVGMVDIRVHSALTIHSEDSENPDVFDLIMLLKPHSKPIVQITINEYRTLLVTCGRDSTIFMYKMKVGSPGTKFTLERLGFIETPNNIEYMTWKPEEERVLLLCGQEGFLMEVVLPDVEVRKYTDITTFRLEFESFKETLVKHYYMRHRPFPTEDDLASLDEEALKAAAEVSDEDKDQEWIGEIELIESDNALGTTITWADYCEDGVWVIQQGTGALLLVKPGLSKILKYAPFEGAWCENITALRFVCEKRYLIIGTNTGYIRVLRMPTEEEDNPDRHWTIWMEAQQKLMKKLKGRRLAKEEVQPIPRIDFTDFYYLPMHDRYTGAISCFEFSFDGKYFFSSGGDGNIFSYKINFEEPFFPLPEELELPEELPKVQRVKEPSTVEGDMMSHEQLKQKEEYDKMMAIANAHKKRVRDQLNEITTEYNKLIKANRQLPVSQQIDVTLDPRPLEVQEKELEELKALAKRKVAHQLEASDLGLHKMYSRNIVQLDVFPFTLRAIRDPNIMIRPLRQKNLSKAFYDQLEEVYQKMAEAALRGRRTESISRRIAAKRASWGPPRVASFLLGLPPKPPHPLTKAIRNYHTRLNRHHIQFIEWQEHLSRKPDPNALPPGAAEALKEAEATIGNRLLKTSPDYVAAGGHNTQLRVCLVRQEIYENKHSFNLKVTDLRHQKVELVETMKKIGERLAEIRVEIPPKKAKLPPTIPQIDDELEFPEKHLEIKPEVTQPSGRAAIAKKTTASSQERRKSTGYPQPRQRQPKVPDFVPLIKTRPLAVSWELVKARADQESTPIEVEIRERRIQRHLYEQDMLLADAEVKVQKFDAQLRQLQRDRIRVQEKNQLLELHLYQLHREMNVLNRFEAHEDKLAERVYVKLMQVRGIQEQIQDCEQHIIEYEEEKERLDLACQQLQIAFKRLVQDDKFADFLRRIFKKKYRPPRLQTDDESSESESSESSSEEDEGSLDSRDIGPIRLDPNVCPEGCSQDIYNQTYELRNQRHKFEQDMLEQDRLIELLRKDIDAHNKVKRKLSVQLDKRKSELREFMMEKQNCMNEIDQVVVLRYDQIRAAALRGCTGPEGLKNTVVFPEQLLLQLRNRVLELLEEIKQQRIRHRINRTHLFRMNIDLREMERQAEEIRAQMRDVLTRKLGKPRKVDKTLDDVLRQMARRHKFSANLHIMPDVLAQFRSWRDRHSELEQNYLKALNHFSDRLRLAAALQADILPIKSSQDPTKISYGYDLQTFQRDIVRLRIIRSQQNQQIRALQQEIQQLRAKPVAEPVTTMESEPPKERRSEIYLFMIPPGPWRPRRKYFPITPLGSQVKMVHDVNIMKLLYDSCDALKVTRDDADKLLADLTSMLPDVIAGVKSRFEIVDVLVRKWLLKHGGDPSQYKKQTKAFDTLAALSDRLIRQHVETMEGATPQSHKIMGAVEEALKDIVHDSQSLQTRLGPTLASLFHAADTADLETEETMTSLVNALIDEDHPLTLEDVDSLEVVTIVEDIKDCGVQVPDAELEYIVQLAIECLRAQILTEEESKLLREETEKALAEMPTELAKHATIPESIQQAQREEPDRIGKRYSTPSHTSVKSHQKSGTSLRKSTGSLHSQKSSKKVKLGEARSQIEATDKITTEGVDTSEPGGGNQDTTAYTEGSTPPQSQTSAGDPGAVSDTIPDAD